MAEPERSSQNGSERSRRSERSRQRILLAAGERFASVGFAKATIEDIARAASVSKALVYVNFSGKEELLEAVLKATLDEWFEVIWSEVDHDTRSVRETIAFIHRASIEYAWNHPVLGCILNRDSTRLLNLVEQPAREIGEDWRRRLVELFTRGVESGELRDDLDVGQLVEVFRLLSLAFVNRLYDPRGIDVKDTDLIEASIEVLLRGISKP